MSFEMEEKITNISMVGRIAISLAACVWFCTSQHKLVKNTKRIADVLKKDYEEMKK